MLVPKFKLLMNITVKPRSIVCADCGSVPYTEEKDKKECLVFLSFYKHIFCV